jgi:hypothetical protein
MKNKLSRLWLVMGLFISTSSFLFGQNIKISGVVNDSSGVNKLNKAVVSLVRLNDSILVDYYRTNQTGEFNFNVPLDTFYLLIEHPQFEAKTLYVFGNPSELSVEIPFIRMGVKVKSLAEVVVQGNKNRVYYKGDTLIYVADSFKVAENAVVEDLLKKLPGIKIDENGQITSQGREISQVLVDGDEFFGSDPTIATKNLGAKGVESVQVYEKKAQDNASGMDEKIQVMDLKLKADAKRGYFGKASIASDGGIIGNPTTNFPFYESELLFNRFDKKQKFSVFFLSSNTPRSNFRLGDMSKFGLENERESSGMSMWDQSSQRTNTGIPQTTKAGIYFNDRIKNWGKIGFNYSFNQNQLNATQSSLSQYFLQDTSYYTKDSIVNITNNTSHKVNLSFVAKLDSLTSIEIKPSVSFDMAETQNITNNQFLTEAKIPTFTSDIETNNESKGSNVRMEATLMRLFNKPRRELEVKYILNKTDNSTTGSLLTQNIFQGFVDSVDQQKKNDNGNLLNYAIVTYTEPLAAKWRLQLEYYLETGTSYQTRNTFSLFSGAYTQLVDSLSNQFENQRLQNRGTAMLIYETSKYWFNFGIGFRTIQLDNYNVIGDSSILQNFSNLLPKFTYTYKPSMGTRLVFKYFTRSDQPSLNDIQPVQDNSNPNRVKVGNSTLKPNYVHSFNFQFNRWEALSGRYLYSGLSATLTNNAFASNTYFDALGRTISKTENVDGNIFSNAFFGVGLPMFNRKLELSPNFNANYSKMTNYINNVENITYNPSIGGGLSLELNFDSLEVKLSQNYFYSSPKSTFNAASNMPYSTQEYKAEFKWTLPLNFKIIADGKYTINSQRAGGFNRNIFVLNAEIQRSFLKTENLLVSINAYDLLNQNLNLQRQVNENIITDNYTRLITRYFLLKLTYRFNKNKTKEDDFEGWH